MLEIMVLVFIGAFIVFALLVLAAGATAAARTKQTLANLQSAVASNTRSSYEQVVDVRKAELFSVIPWINSWLQSLALATRLRTLLNQANLSWTTGTLLMMSVACFVVPTYLLYLRSGTLLFSGVIGLLLGFAPLGFVLQKRNMRFNEFEQGLPEALDLMVSSLRAGQSLAAALRLVALESPDPIGAEFRICFDEQHYGLELRAAMENLVNRVPLQDMRIVVTGILIQKESGGNLAEVLDKASYVIRERFRLKQQVRVHTAQGRLTGWILACLPIFLGIGLYLVNPDVMSVLWTHPVGVKLLYISGAMTVIGMLIIRQIVDMDV
ncbi:MAG: type II secretion system F family protein [Solirubrobacteraceae bacterium]|jgi:tight adherence protein B